MTRQYIPNLLEGNGRFNTTLLWLLRVLVKHIALGT